MQKNFIHTTALLTVKLFSYFSKRFMWGVPVGSREKGKENMKKEIEMKFWTIAGIMSILLFIYTVLDFAINGYH